MLKYLSVFSLVLVEVLYQIRLVFDRRSFLCIMFFIKCFINKKVLFSLYRKSNPIFSNEASYKQQKNLIIMSFVIPLCFLIVAEPLAGASCNEVLSELVVTPEKS